MSGAARIPSGVEGFDLVSGGGLPDGRLTLLVGTAGSGKTMFAMQHLADGIAHHDDPGVFVSFEERPEDLARNFASFGWDVGGWERGGAWTFVDASPRADNDATVVGEYDLASLVLRVREAVQRSGARRLALDSTGALVEQLGDLAVARRALRQIAAELAELDVTTVMTAERPDDYGPVSRFGFEEFVADNVVILRNPLEGERRRRTVEVLKLRGGTHLRGEHLFTIRPDRGIVVVPQQSAGFGYPSSRRRLTSGLRELDEMSRGGFIDRSLVLVTGATGTGKSLLASQFIGGGVLAGERGLLHSFEESRDQLARNAEAWGFDFDAMEREGQLRIVSVAPEEATLEDHLLRMQAEIDEFAPDRVAIDSLTALQRIATAKRFREYLLGLTFHIKSQALLGLVTAASDELDVGSGVAGGLHVSTVSDTIVLLQYVGRGTEVRRAITLLKMRASDHDKAVREYWIDDHGMHIGEPMAISEWRWLSQAT